MHIVDAFSQFNFFRGSAIFVEFFFVLSGFVLAHGYGCKLHLDTKEFIKSRFFRLFPLHVFMLLVFIGFETGKLIASHYFGFAFNNIPFSGVRGLNEIIPNLLLIQSWTTYTSALSFNYPSWSISIEFYMYIILLITVNVLGRFRYVAWLLLSLVAFLLMVTKSGILVKEVISGLSSFFGGCIVYILYTKISHFKISFPVGSLLELFSLTLIVTVVQTSFEFRHFYAIVIFLVTVLLFSFESGFFSKIMKNCIVQFFGKISYSIYMTHAAVLFLVTSTMFILQKKYGDGFTPMVNGERMISTGSEIGNNILVFFILIVVFSVSVLTNKYIETKYQKRGR
tara:strand:- start:5786 stop:6802 length:1017 start_codon:yes stop_codon:yes gene_type:complete